jgi:hypothetical protein
MGAVRALVRSFAALAQSWVEHADQRAQRAVSCYLTRTNSEGKNGMSSSTEEMTQLKDEIKGLEVAQAT